MGQLFGAAGTTKYNKPALGISAQVTRLQSIGLQIADPAAAERALRFIGYFRLKGYFLNFMPAQAGATPRRFTPGTTFADVVNLYQFDRKLRVLVMDETERLEVAIRTVICNELSVAIDPHWYVTHYEQVFLPEFDIYRFLADVKGETSRSKDGFIKHYFNKYDSPLLPPSWVAAECLSFGKWSHLYNGLKIHKNAIARQFSLPADVFGSWLHALTVLRNICAHHGRIWNRHYSIQPKVLRNLSTSMGTLSSFYALAVVIRHMTKTIDGTSDFPARLRALCTAHPAVPTSAMGFPNNWTALAFWQP